MSMIGVCGDNCEYCHRYIATKNGGMAELEDCHSEIMPIDKS